MKPILLALLLCGCATPERVCDIGGSRVNTAQITDQGDIRLKWKVVSKNELPGYCMRPDTNGCAYRYDGLAVLYIADRPQFSNVCRLATFGEEVLHGMGAEHP